MDLSIGTPIYERNGQKIGELNRIVMDGKTGDVSHLVVGKGWLLVTGGESNPTGSSPAPASKASSRRLLLHARSPTLVPDS